MKCVGLAFALVFLYGATAQFDDRLIQTLEDAVENSTISESCQEALGLYFENLLSTTDMWALRMFDATSKMPVGLLSLNLGELGQFTQCIETESADGFTRGRYCLASLSLGSLISSSSLQNEVADIHQKASNFWQASRRFSLMDSSDDDTSSLVTVGLPWAICLPSNCSTEDIGEILSPVFGENSVRCQTKEDLTPSLTVGGIVATTVMAYFAFLMVASTIIDLCYKYAKKEPHMALTAFSVYTNGGKLFAINKNATELTCLNGIRFISMFWVMTGHVYMASMSLPLVNFMSIIEWMNNLRSMTVVNGTLAVDTFFFLSGLLVVYTFLKAKHHGTNFNIIKFYVHRYLRLTPALAATILFTTFLLRYLGSGPKWHSVSTFEESCKNHWWTTLLYVQNYANNDLNYCLPHSWYLSIDMQLYVFSPLFLLPLWKYPKVGVGLVVAGILTFIAVPFSIAYVKELPGIITNLQGNLMDYMKLYYMKTHTRAAPWFIGLLMGFILARMKFNGEYKIRKLNTVVVLLFWAACLSVIITCVYGGHSTLRTDEYDVWANSFYIGLVRPVWAVCLAAMIYACVTGYGGPINALLSLPAFQMLNRLTYSFYLIHYPLMFAYAYTSKTGYYFSELNLAYWYWGITMTSFGLSIIWVLAFESPVVVLERLLFGGAKKKSKPEHNGPKKELPA